MKWLIMAISLVTLLSLSSISYSFEWGAFENPAPEQKPQRSGPEMNQRQSLERQPDIICTYGQVWKNGSCTGCASDNDCMMQYPINKFGVNSQKCYEKKWPDNTSTSYCGCPVRYPDLMCGSGMVCDEAEYYCKSCTSDSECKRAYPESEPTCFIGASNSTSYCRFSSAAQ